MFISKISSNFKRFFSNTSKRPIFTAKKLQRINTQNQNLTYSIKNNSKSLDQEQQKLIKSTQDIGSLVHLQNEIFHQKRSQLADYLYKISQLINPQQYEKYKSFLEQICYNTRKTSSQLTLTTQQLLKILIYMQSMQKFNIKQKKIGGFQVRMSTLTSQIILNKDLSISEAVTLYCLIDSMGYKTLQVVQNLAIFLKNQLKNNKKLSIESVLVILAIYSQKSIRTVIENVLADQIVSNIKTELIQSCQNITLQIENLRILSELQIWRFYKTDSKRIIQLVQVSITKTKNLLETKYKQNTYHLNEQQLFILKQSIYRINNCFKFHQELIKNCQNIDRYCKQFQATNVKQQSSTDNLAVINQKLVKSHISEPEQIIQVLLGKSKELKNLQIVINSIETHPQLWNSISNIFDKKIVNNMEQKQLIQFFFLLSCSSVQQISSTSKKILKKLPFSQNSIYQFLNNIAHSNQIKRQSKLFSSIISSRFQALSSTLINLPTNCKFHYHKWQIFISYYLKQDKSTKLKCFQLLTTCFLEALESQNARKVVLVTYLSNLLADGQVEGTKQELKVFFSQILRQTLNNSKTFHYHCFMRIITNLLACDLLSVEMLEQIIKLGKQVGVKQLYDNCLLMIIFGMYSRAYSHRTKFIDENCFSKQLTFLSKGLKILNFTETDLQNQEQTTNATALYLSALFMSGITDIFQRSKQISNFIGMCKSYSDLRLMLNTYLMNAYKCHNHQQKAKLLLINTSFIKRVDIFNKQEKYKQHLQDARSKLNKIDNQYKQQ